MIEGSESTFAKILLPAWNPTGHVVPMCQHNFHVWLCHSQVKLVIMTIYIRDFGIKIRGLDFGQYRGYPFRGYF